MISFLRQSVRVLTAFLLAAIVVVPQDSIAQTHVVAPQELQQQAVAASQARQKNIEVLNNFLSSPTAKQAIKTVGSNPQQVKTAISNLSDQELAELASRAQKTQADFAAGNLTDHDLLVILIAIAALILIIVAVHH